MQETGIEFEIKRPAFKTTLYIHRLLYQNIMRTSNQNTTINTTHMQIIIKPQENKRKEED